jgi:hypothetical protein
MVFAFSRGFVLSWVSYNLCSAFSHYEGHGGDEQALYRISAVNPAVKTTATSTMDVDRAAEAITAAVNQVPLDTDGSTLPSVADVLVGSPVDVGGSALAIASAGIPAAKATTVNPVAKASVATPLDIDGTMLATTAAANRQSIGTDVAQSEEEDSASESEEEDSASESKEEESTTESDEEDENPMDVDGAALATTAPVNPAAKVSVASPLDVDPASALPNDKTNIDGGGNVASVPAGAPEGDEEASATQSDEEAGAPEGDEE